MIPRQSSVYIFIRFFSSESIYQMCNTFVRSTCVYVYLYALKSFETHKLYCCCCVASFFPFILLSWKSLLPLGPFCLLMYIDYCIIFFLLLFSDGVYALSGWARRSEAETVRVREIMKSTFTYPLCVYNFVIGSSSFSLVYNLFHLYMFYNTLPSFSCAVSNFTFRKNMKQFSINFGQKMFDV